MANIFESAFMTLKNGMTMYFADSKARELIDKLKALVDTKYGPDNPQPIPTVEGSRVWYATCSTSSGTADKVATSSTGDFVLATGNMVRILFSETNIQTQPTLSVDGCTAKRIKNITSDTNITTNLWRAGEVIDVVYDGTQFVVVDGGLANGTYYGRTILSNSTSSASQTTAATSKAVKDAYDLADSKVDAAGAAAAAPVQSVDGQTGAVTTFSGNYNDLTNKPTLGTIAAEDTPLAVAKGGTDATTQTDALLNLQAYDLNRGTSIPANANLNTYTTVGTYYCSANATAATLTNCPTAYAFKMVVEYIISSTYIRQTIMGYSGDSVWTRVRTSSSTWTSWRKDISTIDYPLLGVEYIEDSVTASFSAGAIGTRGYQYHLSQSPPSGKKLVGAVVTYISDSTKVNPLLFMTAYDLYVNFYRATDSAVSNVRVDVRFVFATL